MVLDASDSLTTLKSPATDGTVHWTQFPAHAVAIDWSDHRAAHRAVMRLFAEDLNGLTGQVRSHSGVLFRIDILGQTPVVLVQSLIAPMLVPPSARTLVLSGRTWNTNVGDPVRFRVAVNSIVRNGRAKTEKVVPAAEAPDWIADRLTPALGEITVLNHYRDTYQEKRYGRTVKEGDALTIDVIDGHATVTDPATLNALRIHGVGRRKSYGAGLLTVQRLG